MYRVHGPCTAVYPVRSRPCTQAVKTIVCTVHGHVRYTARARPYTRYVHDRARPCTQAVNTTVCTVHGRVRAVYMAMFGSCMAVYRVHTRREQPCTRSVHGRGHVRHGHGSVNGPCTTGTQAVYMPCLRPVPVCTDTGRKRASVKTAVDGLYTTEAETKSETHAKAEAKVIITRPRPAIVYSSGSTDLLRSFETANYLIPLAGMEVPAQLTCASPLAFLLF